jgi:hypothetical protein
VIAIVAIFCLTLFASAVARPSASAARTRVVKPGDFERVLDEAQPGDTLLLKVGVHHATPTAITEETCGNCLEPLTRVQATVGFHINGTHLTIIGESRDSTVLSTGAGYGVLFEDSYGSRLTNLTITGDTLVTDVDGTRSDIGVFGGPAAPRADWR